MKNTQIAQIIVGCFGIIGLLWFGRESPEFRTNIKELCLAGAWFLLMFSSISKIFLPNKFSSISVFWHKGQSQWYRKVFAVISAMMVVLYLVKYFQG